MASNTTRFGLLKKDPTTDGNDTFNIQTMLNDNWDKLDDAAKKSELDAHTDDTTVHITAAERTTWNNKAEKSVATQTSDGLMSKTDKTKLDGIAAGAEVNQNAFANIKVGSTTVSADSKTDTLELVAGSNVTLTPDATNDKVTIAANVPVSSVNGKTGAVTISASDVNAYSKTETDSLLAPINDKLAKADRQTQTLEHGLSVLNGDVGAPVDIQIEGRTLVNVSQNVLDPAKYYVLSDKKSKVKFSDGTTYAGVTKFAGRAEKPILIRVSNFENKVSGSTVENPHVVKYNTQTSLQQPSIGSEGTQTHYDNIKTLSDSKLFATTINSNGAIAQQTYSFNIIEAIERNVGKIPASDKVAWLKNNIARITCNWWGYGSSPSGYKASFTVFSVSSNAWYNSPQINNTSNINKLTFTIQASGVPSNVDANGFINFLAYAYPSDGTTASTINTDYVELEIELKPEAQLWNPRFPLYEVDATTEYPNILTTWDENEVMRRYPMVESVQHVQNPYVMAEGENLLPPFTEWNLHANAVVREPYKLELNATGTYQGNIIYIPIIGGQTYTLSLTTNGMVYVDTADANKNTIRNTVVNNATGSINKTIVINSNESYLRLNFSNNTTGTFTFTNPMLTLGSNAKPFVPRNPSYLYAEAKLGAIGDKKDILWKDGTDYKITKWIEKDLTADKLTWSFHADGAGYKVFKATLPSNAIAGVGTLVRYNGVISTPVSNESSFTAGEQYYISSNTIYISVSDAISGMGETYTPISDEIKALIVNGWQAKTVDANGKPTAWRSLVDGTDAPTQTITYVKDNMAPNFTPYKLSYVLATPQTIVVSDKVEGDLVVNGATQVEVGSGFTYTETDGKRTYTLLTDSQRVSNTVNITDATATYANNIRSALDDVAAKVSDNTHELTLHNFALDYIQALAENNAIDIDNLQTYVDSAPEAMQRNFGQFLTYRSGKDSNGVFTTVDYKRTDGTLFARSVLSNADTNGNYQTRTITYYAADGTTVVRTDTWTLAYDADGDLVSEVKS